MKSISRLYQYDEKYFAGKVPSEAMQVSSSLEEDFPIYIEENFISEHDCRKITDQFTREGISEKAGFRNDGNGIRKAFNFILRGKANDIYTEAFERTRPQVEHFFRTRITGSAGNHGAHGLGYSPGCKYDVHADNSNAVLDTTGQLQEFRLVDANRQLSSVLFLTESVDEISGTNQNVGGNLSFRFILDKDGEMLLVEPRPGLFIVFPSSPIFCHEVHEIYEVSSGYRMSIVNWYACAQET